MSRETTMGTSYFVSEPAAVRYYRPYFTGNHRERLAYVRRKIEAGEIHIGKPPMAGKLSIIDEGTRYAITTSDSGSQGCSTESP